LATSLPPVPHSDAWGHTRKLRGDREIVLEGDCGLCPQHMARRGAPVPMSLKAWHGVRKRNVVVGPAILSLKGRLPWPASAGMPASSPDAAPVRHMRQCSEVVIRFERDGKGRVMGDDTSENATNIADICVWEHSSEHGGDSDVHGQSMAPPFMHDRLLIAALVWKVVTGVPCSGCGDDDNGDQGLVQERC